jgi:hypothetical protein
VQHDVQSKDKNIRTKYERIKHHVKIMRLTGDRYTRDIRPKAKWTIIIFAMQDYAAVGLSIYIHKIECLYVCYLMKS